MDVNTVGLQGMSHLSGFLTFSLRQDGVVRGSVDKRCQRPQNSSFSCHVELLLLKETTDPHSGFLRFRERMSDKLPVCDHHGKGSCVNGSPGGAKRAWRSRHPNRPQWNVLWYSW